MVFNKEQIQKNINAANREEKIRCQVFLATINTVEDNDKHTFLRNQAAQNLQQWQTQAKAKKAEKPAPVIEIHEGDWGVVTRQLTEKYGETFAVLNMANAYSPGGGVAKGMIAQEENMYRRTDCCQYILPEDVIAAQASDLQYREEMSALINGEHGRVYLDSKNPRVCFKGPEDKASPELGYALLDKKDIFPFYELRAAAIDCHHHTFNADITRAKIRAQLATLQKNGIRNAVLSAFGCGAFKNPPAAVAQLYKEELDKMAGTFDHIAFAVYNPGYGPRDNYKIFAEKLGLAIPTPDPGNAPHSPSKSFLTQHWGKLLALAVGVTLILAATIFSGGLVLLLLGSVILALAALKTLGDYFLPQQPKAEPIQKTSADAPSSSASAPLKHRHKPQEPAQQPLKRSMSHASLSPSTLFRAPQLKRVSSHGRLPHSKIPQQSP